MRSTDSFDSFYTSNILTSLEIKTLFLTVKKKLKTIYSPTAPRKF